MKRITLDGYITNFSMIEFELSMITGMVHIFIGAN